MDSTTNPHRAALDRVNPANAATVAGTRRALVRAASGMQSQAEADRLMGVACLFALVMKVYDARPEDLLPAAQNLLSDPATGAWNPEFRAIHNYLLNQSSVVQSLKKERQAEERASQKEGTSTQ